MTNRPFLEVKNLNVAFPTEDGVVQASNDISFTVARGETLAVVGEDLLTGGLEDAADVLNLLEDVGGRPAFSLHADVEELSLGNLVVVAGHQPGAEKGVLDDGQVGLGSLRGEHLGLGCRQREELGNRIIVLRNVNVHFREHPPSFLGGRTIS